MKHLFARRGIIFLEQVPHRLVPVSFDLALSHPRARSVDALRNCLRLSPVAVIVTATLAFTTTAPMASLTVPTMSDVVIWPKCLLPRQKTNTATAHAECRVDYNRPQVAASAPGSLGSMVLYSLSALIPQWKKCCGECKNTRPSLPTF